MRTGAGSFIPACAMSQMGIQTAAAAARRRGRVCSTRPAAAAQAGAVGPVATLFLDWLVLGEPISSLQLLGTAVVISGIWILMKLSGARA
jgi:drug/metabolite transporter (DMT)-like permease